MKMTLLASTAAIVIAASAAFAQSASDQIVTDLQGQGFTYIEIKEGPNTIKVDAVRGDLKLEVVYDAATGAILSQETQNATANEQTLTGVEIKTTDTNFDANGNDGQDDQGVEDNSNDNDSGVDDSNDDNSGADDSNDDDSGADDSNDDDSGHDGGSDDDGDDD